MMSLTIEESTTKSISPFLNHILTKIVAQTKSFDNLQKDIMFITITVLMIENNFVLVNDNLKTTIRLESIDLNQLLKWKSRCGLYEASFMFPDFKNITLKLIMSPLGTIALVTAVIKELDSDSYTVCLPISRYVVSPQATSIPLIFRDLKHLSVTFKNKIISPVKSKILNHFGYASASLIGLPEELIFKIMIYLPIADILDVSRTCNTLKNVLQSEALWHSLCKRDFSSFLENTDGKDWKTIYKELYISHSERKQILRFGGTMHDHMDYSDYVSYIDNPMWGVII